MNAAPPDAIDSAGPFRTGVGLRRVRKPRPPVGKTVLPNLLLPLLVVFIASGFGEFDNDYSSLRFFRSGLICIYAVLVPFTIIAAVRSCRAAADYRNLSLYMTLAFTALVVPAAGCALLVWGMSCAAVH